MALNAIRNIAHRTSYGKKKLIISIWHVSIQFGISANHLHRWYSAWYLDLMECANIHTKYKQKANRTLKYKPRLKCLYSNFITKWLNAKVAPIFALRWEKKWNNTASSLLRYCSLHALLFLFSWILGFWLFAVPFVSDGVYIVFNTYWCPCRWRYTYFSFDFIFCYHWIWNMDIFLNVKMCKQQKKQNQQHHSALDRHANRMNAAHQNASCYRSIFWICSFFPYFTLIFFDWTNIFFFPAFSINCLKWRFVMNCIWTRVNVWIADCNEYL